MALLVTNLIWQMNPPQAPPSTPRFKQLSRDQNILESRIIKYLRMKIKENFQIHGLHEAGTNQTQIAA